MKIQWTKPTKWLDYSSNLGEFKMRVTYDSPNVIEWDLYEYHPEREYFKRSIFNVGSGRFRLTEEVPDIKVKCDECFKEWYSTACNETPEQIAYKKFFNR